MSLNLASSPHAFALPVGALVAKLLRLLVQGNEGQSQEDLCDKLFNDSSERKYVESQHRDAGRDKALWRWSSRRRRRSRMIPASRHYPAFQASDTLELRPGTETL